MLSLLITVIILTGAIIFSLQFKPVQTWLAKKAANYLSSELETRVEIKSLYLKPFKSLVLEGFLIEDLEKDTLLQAPLLSVDIRYFAPISERKIDIDFISLKNGKLFFKEYKDSTTNLSFIINYFSSGSVDTLKKGGKPFDINFDKIKLENLDLKYINYYSTDVYPSGVNYDNVHLKNFSTEISGLDTKTHLLKAQINNLTFKEKSGFYLKNLTALTVVDNNHITLSNLLLETPNTTLRDFYSMKFDSFRDFKNFTKKIRVEGHFKNTKIWSEDIAFFAPDIKGMNFSIEADGLVKGLVNNLKAKSLTIKAGKSTYIKGDFDIKGLPDWKNTFMDLRFDQIATDKKDMEFVLGKLTFNDINKFPEVFDKFGHINFKGKYVGFHNDFIAYGEFKTKLGLVKSDVNMKFTPNGEAVYTGKVEGLDFNIGELLNEESIKRTSFTANIKGKNFDTNTLSEEFDAKIKYFDFNGYRYSNIDIKGGLDKLLFNGIITVNDKNIKLNFNGIANFNTELPVFNFDANIRSANLHKLNLSKDTIQIDTDFKTNFSGYNLDNIQGKLALNNIKTTTKDTSFVINTVDLTAEGIGKERLLALTSDIGDASIRGQYDLATLPSAFKTVIKKYIPKAQFKTVIPKNQNFDFTVDLKNFNHLSSIFFPELKIPDRGVFNGKFDSEKNFVSLNAFAKTVSYNNIIFSNVIIDQITTDKSFETTVTLDKIELENNNMFVKNIVLQNTLKSDSLTFNIKLSDKDAVNQLDLYGLVEFGSDTLAKLSLLPSDLIIENDVWKIQDKVKFKFEEKRTIIENFELSNKQQILAINGAISSSKDDLLEIVTENFRLSSLSQLTKGLGVELSGIMNGSANLSAILGEPDINADLSIDSLKYNETDIGKMLVNAQFDNQQNNIQIKSTIEKNKKRTADIAGIVDFKKDAENLNLDVNLNGTEIIIFEPFVNELVSDLKGQISSTLKVTGPFSKPQINGNVNLINAGFTVNYLKTPYIINDDVTFNNSIINLDNLILSDKYNNTAIANGTVDLTDASNPNIQATIKATNFLALNTTAKDNPLYYGSAFATGTFTFEGPTDAMDINIKARTEEGTVFTIPFNAAATIGENDFITYVAKDTSVFTPVRENFFKGLTMEFELTVGHSSVANLITDVGNIYGRGDGLLRLRITSLGDFEMFGDYIIDDGKFDFTSNNVINKTFEIKKGGTIRWTGNPSEATINLSAAYSTRANLLPLYQAAGRTLSDDRRNERVLAEAEMILNGSLLNPDINFGLEFPNNTGIKTELQGYLDNEDNESQQVINLVVRNNFNGSSGAGIGFTNSDLLGSGLELAFSKLNNIISQSLNIKNLDINVRSQSEIGGSYSFFDNRLKISGNFVNNKYNVDNMLDNNILNSSFTDLTRDLEMTYNINRDGTFVAKVFQRPTNRDFFNLNRDIYVNGFGLVFTQEYDTFAEFIRNIFAKRRQQQQGPVNTPTNNNKPKGNTNTRPIAAPIKPD